MKHKIGDKVKIKSLKAIEHFLDTHDTDFPSGWVPDMEIYCGKEAIIVGFGYENSYSIDIDIDGFKWDDEMFEDKIDE